MVKYYSALKRNEILSHATTWVNPEDIISEINQTQQDKYYMIPPMWDTYSSQIHRDRKQNSGCQGLEGWREMGSCWMGCTVCFRT